jgi:phosphoribosyl-ATP pyrophosphohydrolase/phosphoribosyl-AMP cyclohydrolase
MTKSMPAWIEDVRYDERGLVPCIVQDSFTGEVLMHAWMDTAALEKTVQSGEMWFWSRSRQQLWHKGATSGSVQTLVSLHLDCDGDTLLALVQQVPGKGACHTGAPTCFDPDTGFEASEAGSARPILAELMRVIADRDEKRPEGSYTTKLLVGGIDRSGKKVVEEAGEVVIAAKNAQAGAGFEELADESADLLFHLLVLWRSSGIDPTLIDRALRRRR